MQELKKLKIWLCWNHRKNRDGKWTKIPISASGGETGTDEAHRDTWVTYEEAVKAASENHYSGVGFVIPEGCFLLDIDHVDLNDPSVQELLDRFKDTYAEVSVSGRGIHIIGKADLSRIPTYRDKDGKLRLSPEYFLKNSKAGIELYPGGITNRYSTYSGDVINDVPVRDCTEAILTTLDQSMRRPVPEKAAQKVQETCPELIPARDEPAPQLTQEELDSAAFEVVCTLRKQKNAEKFSNLYDRGDLSGYKSRSEADLALCTLIAFRTGNNPDLIDWIFRGSALYREKWDRDDYRDETIRKAIEGLGGVFAGSPKCLPSFISVNNRGKPSLNAALLASHIRKTEKILLVQDNGKQGTLTLVYEDGHYKLYSKEMMLGLIKAPVEALCEGWVNYSKISEAYNLLITDRERITQDQLNADEHLINFRNGILKVTPESLELVPHSPDVYSTIQIPCDWTGEETPTPVFDSYLRTLTDGDEQVAQLLLQVIGVILSNVKCWRMKKSLFLAGPGDTGKSVLKSLVEKLLGPGNYIGIDLQGIEARFGTGAIYNTRLAGSSDMSFMTVSELKTFKQLTGGDSVFAEFKGQQSFEFTYGGFIMFCMNKVPKFGGDDGQWVYDRIMVVNCRNVIPRDQQDKEILDKLYAEREGILYKAVRALQQVMANGYRFSEPASVSAARADYQRSNNSVIGFYHECMCPRKSFNKSDESTVTEVYDAYRDWCRDNNNGYTKTKKEFKESLAEYLDCGVEDLTIHTERGTSYKSITLTEETRKQFMGFVA